ncbi:MAG: FAD binding domain-containing protein [Spirochaetes bacterium]|nr:FAD binding domain-containing protein [Spirochaetota bacterium]MBU1079696.1 FAD binding domain-containing protein [Spirochaetota bacterium]
MVYEFRYLAPRTATELATVLDDIKADGRILAGGTDLIPNIRNGVFKPRIVVDVKKFQGADRMAFGSEGLSMGPAVTINDVLRSKDARERYPSLCACAHELASHQVRNRATVAGNVVNASPCSDMAPALLCLGARAVIRSATGERVVPFANFFAGVKKTVLVPGEFLATIIIPAESAGAAGRYLKLKRIAGHDLGIVGVLMTRKDGELRFGVSSAAPTPVLVDTVGAKDDPDEAARKVLASVSPISDVRGTKEYREHMIGVYVRRLLSEVE